MTYSASSKQVAFIRDLATALYGADGADGYIAGLEANGTLADSRKASAAIDALKIARKNAAATPEAEPLEAGMYRKPDGTIYKVQKAIHGSGRMYAKRLTPPSDFGGTASFDYAPGVVGTLTPAMRLSLEDAKAFGALYGTCCVCGRTLTDERSIAEGIGPVCGKRWF